MIRLVRIELLKLRTTPALWVTIALTGLLTAASVFATVLLAGQPGTAPLGSVENVSKVLAVGAATSAVMLVLGIMIAAGEDRHRTHRPDRPQRHHPVRAVVGEQHDPLAGLNPQRLKPFPRGAHRGEEVAEGDASLALDQEGALRPALHPGEHLGERSRPLGVEKSWMSGVVTGVDFFTPRRWHRGRS